MKVSECSQSINIRLDIEFTGSYLFTAGGVNSDSIWVFNPAFVQTFGGAKIQSLEGNNYLITHAYSKALLF